MRNYIKSELYRSFNRMTFWNTIGIISVLEIIFNILLRVNAGTIPYEDLFGVSKGLFNVTVFVIIIIIDIITAEEQKNNTLKNAVSSGISREKIILSKIISTIILLIILGTIVLFIYFGSGAILFKVSSTFSMSIVRDFIVRLLLVTLLLIAAISIGTLLSIVIKNNTTFAFVYAGVFMMNIFIKFFMFLGMDKLKYIYNILITTQLKNLSTIALNSENITHIILLAIIYIIIFTTLNIIYFRNMDVK